MQIILKEDMPALGRKGDVVKVADGYGRNFLLPYRKAIEATAANLRNIEQMRASAAHKDQRDQQAALGLAAELAKVRLVFERRAGEHDTLFGSVTSMDVTHALKERGFDIERRQIELPDPIKKLGDHAVPLHLFKGVVAEITVEVQRQAEEGDAGEGA